MSKDTVSRRRFMKEVGAICGAMVMGAGSAGAAARRTQRGKLHLACNHYPWIVYYQRDGKDFNALVDEGLAEMASCGIDGFEPIIGRPEDVERLAPLLNKHRLQMRSLYVNSALHEKEQAEKSIEGVLAIAEKAKAVMGTRIIVTNPSPIRWGGPENKNDEQLTVQAAAMEKLGRQLKSMGLTLSYHNHDIELREAAREFHHMMAGTDPALVTLCLDAHWIYRGSGNSQVALFDVLKLYGKRVTELHLRQSKDNVWSETFGEGDIDYKALADYLLTIGVRPHLVLEQAVEGGTPKTMGTVEAFRKSSEYARGLFGGFVGVIR
jgi:inosose dehydratase